MQQIRLMGTTADVGITNVTENQLVEISKSNLVLDVGIQQRLGSVDTEQWGVSDFALTYSIHEREGLISSEMVSEIGQLDGIENLRLTYACLLYTSPSPRDGLLSRMPSSA